MSGKRSMVLLCLGTLVAAAVASQWNRDYVARLRAHRVKETVLVSAGHRRLAGFFDGMLPEHSAESIHIDRNRELLQVLQEHGALRWYYLLPALSHDKSIYDFEPPNCRYKYGSAIYNGL